MRRRTISLRADPPDLLIRPPLGPIRFLEFARAEEIIRIGYESTEAALAGLDGSLVCRSKTGSATI